jgi:transposase
LTRDPESGIVIITLARRPDPKTAALRAQGALHPRPGAVRAPVFDTHPFFDRRDVVQVKYEMLRQVDVDGQPITASGAAVGFSRPTFYQAAAAFQRAGLPGLLPQKRGPRRAHKLGEAVMAFVQMLRADEAMGARALAARVEARFGVPVHPRSIERALRRAEKKPR